MLNLNAVSFKYGKTKLFNNISIEFEEGKIVGLLGKNGAGKTTLLKIISGLLFPHDGICRYGDIETSRRDPKYLENLFFLPEEFYLPPIKGELFLELRGRLYPNFDYDLFYEILKEFGVDLGKNLNTLSFGQKKKFLLSFGLSTGASLVIMDEPTNGLDIPSKAIFRRVIARAMSPGRTIIISTHQVKDVENLIDSIVIVDNGEIIFNHSLFEVSSTLSMGSIETLKGDEIYYQESMGKYQTVSPNITGEDSSVDFELLFNSVTSKREAVKALFSKEKVSE